jgi:hypothetical protein
VFSVFLVSVLIFFDFLMDDGCDAIIDDALCYPF